MVKKVLILGKDGQLGNTLTKILQKKHVLMSLNKIDGNIKNKTLIEKKIKEFKPDFIINAAAYTNVEAAEKNKNEAFLINAESVLNLSNLSKKYDSILIHFSTDYVFDGIKNKCYEISDIPNPINVYGQSKLKGEYNILKTNNKFYIIRISWLLSDNKNSFLSKIIKLILTKKEINVVNDQKGSPISTEFVAKICDMLILKKEHSFNQIFHLSTKGKVDWYEIVKYLQQKIPSLSKYCKVSPINSENYISNVKRPKNSLLNHYDIETYLNIRIPDWKTDIDPIIKKISKKINYKNDY
ncbi:dTDP-4-dehydrorhamnose reductase [Alphaproteobacteria bacterium]|nr:dTDP-4-dehydrorhamnose reductase [Alphaproteobacteria bacterium]